MLILFIEYHSEWEGSWKTFIALCSTEEIAVQIAIKYYIKNHLKDKIDNVQNDLKNNHFHSTHTPSQVSVLMELKKIEEGLLTSTYMRQIDHALIGTKHNFSLEEIKLISDIEEYVIE